MKRYRLLKDLPTFKAGQLAYMSELSNLMAGTPEKPETTDDGGILMIYHKNTLEKFPEILTDWFEEIQESTDNIHWKPKEWGLYFYIDSNGNIASDTWHNTDIDNIRCELGLMYKIYSDCRRVRDRQLAEARLRRTSIFEPDFENRNGGWIVVYNYAYHKLFAENIRFEDAGEPVRYATKEDAEKSIKENEQDWLIYFGIDPSDIDES